MFSDSYLINIAILVALGTVPSLIWLFYYLSKDVDREPKKIILQVFLLGGLATIWALILESLYLEILLLLGFECESCKGLVPDFLGAANFQILSTASFIIIFGLAFIEEFLKYAVVKSRMLHDRNFDVPVDAMIYLIVSALGFAAAENIGYILSDMENALGILYFRFLTATFLHALASAIVGYFFALSIIHKKSHFTYLSIGILSASFLHAMFNTLILLIESSDFAIIYLIILLITSYYAVSFLFKRIKTLHYNLQTIQ